MKSRFARLLTVALVAAVLVQAGTLAHAKTKSAGGIKGTISSLGSSGFVLTLATKPTTSPSAAPTDASTTLNVLCDKNTKFYKGTAVVDPSEIKEGITVAVIGASTGPNELLATRVTIEAATKKSKK